MKRIGAVLGALAILVATGLGQVGVSAAAGPVAGTVETPTLALPAAPYGGASISRLGGVNRYEVSVAVSKRAFADPANPVAARSLIAGLACPATL